MCPSCGFYKGRMVLDLTVEHASRNARITARKDAKRTPEASETSEQQAPEQIEEVAVEKPKRTRAKNVVAEEKA